MEESISVGLGPQTGTWVLLILSEHPRRTCSHAGVALAWEAGGVFCFVVRVRTVSYSGRGKNCWHALSSRILYKTLVVGSLTRMIYSYLLKDGASGALGLLISRPVGCSAAQRKELHLCEEWKLLTPSWCPCFMLVSLSRVNISVLGVLGSLPGIIDWNWTQGKPACGGVASVSAPTAQALRLSAFSPCFLYCHNFWTTKLPHLVSLAWPRLEFRYAAVVYLNGLRFTNHFSLHHLTGECVWEKVQLHSIFISGQSKQ